MPKREASQQVRQQRALVTDEPTGLSAKDTLQELTPSAIAQASVKERVNSLQQSLELVLADILGRSCEYFTPAR